MSGGSRDSGETVFLFCNRLYLWKTKARRKVFCGLSLGLATGGVMFGVCVWEPEDSVSDFER